MMRTLPLAAAALAAASIAFAGPHSEEVPQLGREGGRSGAARAVLASAPQPAASPSAAAESSIEAVSITTRDNIALAGDFYASRKKGRVPAVLLVHDMGGDRSQLAPIAERLQKLGFAVLALDLRGHGQSRSERYDWAKLDDDARERMWVLTPRDLAAGAEYLRSRSDVHTSNLSLVGLRAGSAVAVHYAADDQNARAVVILDPQPDGHGFALAKDVEKLQGLPTLILAPSDQRNVAERLAQCGTDGNGGSAFISKGFLKGDNGNLLDDKRLPKEVADWLKDTVMPGKDDH